MTAPIIAGWLFQPFHLLPVGRLNYSRLVLPAIPIPGHIAKDARVLREEGFSVHRAATSRKKQLPLEEKPRFLTTYELLRFALPEL